MLTTVPNILTLMRVLAVPVLVLVYYLPGGWAAPVTTGLFIAAGLTDWLDGYLARRLEQQSPFGAFLDPVADKLMVAAALVLLVSDQALRDQILNSILFIMSATLIIGREIVVSALREWMAELGRRASVAVSMIGKVKTFTQFLAISLLLYQKPLWGIQVVRLGELLLYGAAVLTLWSMVMYLRAAWPSLMEQEDASGPGGDGTRSTRKG